MSQRLSIVIPARDEAQALPLLLADLRAVRAAGAEVIVVDGGSLDSTVALARLGADQVLHAPSGRARQMNAGAAAANGDYLWFVHADTRVDAPAVQRLLEVLDSAPLWGRFDVRLSGRALALRVIGSMISLRSRLTGIATGDQGIFVERSVFARMGGYADLPLMEDIELCRRLRKRARPCCVRPPLVTSSRRWEQHGTWRTVWLMWRLRLAYYCGAEPAELARRYRGGASS